MLNMVKQNPGQEQARAYHHNSKWGLVYIFSVIAACIEAKYSYRNGWITVGQIVSMGLGAIFGMYFCFFVKEKLPGCYDKKRIGVYTDTLFEMNCPGLSFNNRNWGKIIKAVRIWAVAVMLAYPVISYIEALFFTGIWQDIVDLGVVLVVAIGGLFVPVYIVGKKYE